ncbi:MULTISPECIES: FAD-dependent oxidoreductase [unclassified Nocardioides]|uniref:FAD-dependent oxidoreductase n=1 Tax=unclassified Nocardioides TaxID=2615069 RepID=UPI0009EFADF6|nr:MULTISPECIES: FAD-dependent oxidoreductase [unclassified Nocardioides]GAW48673.1 cyclic nucleotide-regulated FAD-dependent pyridine nucleotide-disulfide oxidoreductase [Nocardioides sp. PD653-B2]GAW54228.1 cyclic nucleotide-regulated FAD-dependent pyridine nucleotide-disulfide oxidoreductase [Nocardioides sp. PD653]
MRTSSSSESAAPQRPETPDLSGAYPRLNDEQVMMLSRFGTRRRVPAGAALFHEGDHDCDFFVILDGLVAVGQQADHESRLVAVHGPRRFLGDLSLLTGQPLYVTAIAEVDAEVLAVPVERLQEAVVEDPGLGDLILRAFIVRRSLHAGIGAGFRIVGSRFSADSRRIRDFSSRNRIPHRWVDLEEDPEAENVLRQIGISPEQTPVVIWKGEHVLRNPSNAELATLIGLRAAPAREAYDLVIVGAGPAGLAAAVYGASEGLSSLVLDAVATGGQAATSSQIENYLGFPAGISGAELADRAVVQARKFGATFTIPGEALSLRDADGYHLVGLTDGEHVTAHAVILATGVQVRRLDVPGLDRLEGSSVYYAATEAEAQWCGGNPVTVVGGGNSAGQAALFLSRRSSAVHLVIRHHDLHRDMSRYLADRIERTPRIRVWSDSELCRLDGDVALESVVLRERESGREHVVDSAAVFVLVGSTPRTAWLDGRIELDEHGYVRTGVTSRRGSVLETDTPGVFAVGDVRSGSVKRVASAVGEGSMAVRLVHEFLERAGRR